MSLINQLLAAIFAALIVLVAGTLYIMTDSSREMLLRQLESHGQDTATNLGLYLAPYIANNDAAAVETTVNAIFDSGFYQEIQIVDSQERIISEVTIPPSINQEIPAWFVGIMDLNPPRMSQEVSHAWRKVGAVHVQARANNAYKTLWDGTRETLIWFAFLSLLVALTISYLIRRILRPLKRVEQQAAALAERRYVEQDEIPKTRELKQVVEAMNHMVKRVHLMFDQQAHHIDELRKTAHLDNLTGLANQRATQAQLADWLDHRKEFGPGICLTLHMNELQRLNRFLGQEKTDNLIQGLAKKLTQTARRYEPHITGRLSGAELIALLPITDEVTLKREVGQLSSEINTQLAFYNTDLQTQGVSLSVTTFEENTCAATVLSEARLATRKAIDQQAAVLYPERFSGSQTASQDWQQHVANAINRGQVFLQYQPVITPDNNQPAQKELLARILNQQEEPCTASEFIHVIKALGLTPALDKTVLQKAFEYLTKSPDTPLTVNISQPTLQDETLHLWIKEQTANLVLTGKLNIEINETAVLSNIDRAAQLREQLKNLGIGFGIDNFGIHPSGFSYLYAVQPDYIKIDGSLCREVDRRAEDRFFISSLITAAHSLGIQAYAERIERESQIEQLVQLKIDALQGFYYGQPQPLNPDP